VQWKQKTWYSGISLINKGNLARIRGEGSWDKLDSDIERIYDDFVRDFGHFETVLSRLFRENSSGKFNVLPRTDFSIFVHLLHLFGERRKK